MLSYKKTKIALLVFSVLAIVMVGSRLAAAEEATISDPSSFCTEVLAGEWQMGGGYPEQGECYTGPNCEVSLSSTTPVRVEANGCDRILNDEMKEFTPAGLINYLLNSKGLPEGVLDRLNTYNKTGGGSGTTTIGNDTFEAKCTNSADISSNECIITKRLVDFIRVLTGIVAMVVVIMIAVGGIQYSSARDNPQAVAAAKARIQNAIIGLILYIFTFAFLQWVIPGGVF